mgnify:CR=1 FL=1
MTKIVEYKCNLCLQTKDRLKIWGLYWTSAQDAKLVEPQQAENHLCESCIQAAAVAYEKIKSKSNEKAIAP